MHDGIPQLLLTSATLTMGLVALLRSRDRTVERRRSLRIALVVLLGLAVLFAGWGVFRAFDWMRYVSDSVAAFRGPTTLRSVRITPANQMDILIDNPDDLAKLSDAFHRATPWSTRKRDSGGRFLLEVQTDSGKAVALVCQDGQDAILAIRADAADGPVLAQYKSDDLCELLEHLVLSSGRNKWTAPDASEWLLTPERPEDMPVLQAVPDVPTTEPGS